MLGLHRVACTAALQQFRRERRDACDLDGFAFGQRVANAQLAVVRDADDVAGPCLFRQFTVRGEEQHRVRNRHGLFRAHMCQLHTALEMARRQAQERHAVAVLRVHVGLNLEHKARDLLFFGRDFTRLGAGRLGFGRKTADAFHQFLHAERVDGRTEPDRRQVTFKNGLGIKRRQQFAGHFDLFAQLFQQLGRHVFGQFGIVQTFQLDRLGDLVPVGTVHQFQPVVDHVVGAKEIATNPDGPGRRRDVNRQIFLNFVNNLERVAAFAVHLVTEGQDGQIAQAADLEQLLRLAFNTLRTVNHHHSRVDSGQRAIGVFGKVRVTGGVDKVEAILAEIKGHRRSRDRDTAVFFHLHKVRPRAAGFTLGTDLTGHLDRPAEKQELFGQRRLTRVGVRDDRKGTAPRDFGRQFGAV